MNLNYEIKIFRIYDDIFQAEMSFNKFIIVMLF